jgi:hypothetical protein
LLLKRLTQGMLEVNDAHELKHLFQKEIKNARKNKDDLYEKQLFELIAIIDSYLDGEIKLRTYPVIKTTTLKYDIQ